MGDAIVTVLQWINDLVVGMASIDGRLVGTIENFMPTLFGFVEDIMTNIIQPVAYTVLALFFLLELHKASVRTEGMAGSPSNFGAEIIFKVMVRMIICKLVIDRMPDILKAIYNVTTQITIGISGVVVDGVGALPLDTLADTIDGLGFWSGLVCLILCFFVFLITAVAVLISNIIISARFIELYIYFAIAPIPVATLPSEEMSQIGKNFLKSFAAVCIHGTLIYIVLSFIPYLFSLTLLDDTNSLDIFKNLLSVVGYSFVLVVAVTTTGKLSKSICNAM